MYAFALPEPYDKLLDLINQHLNARGSKKDDYTYLRHEEEVTYVVRMCQEIADTFGLPYQEVRRLETYCSGSADYSHKFALRLAQLAQGGNND